MNKDALKAEKNHSPVHRCQGRIADRPLFSACEGSGVGKRFGLRAPRIF